MKKLARAKRPFETTGEMRIHFRFPLSFGLVAIVPLLLTAAPLLKAQGNLAPNTHSTPGTAGASAGRSSPPTPPVVQFFDAKGVRLRYVFQGLGEPVVLVHGLHSSGDMNWGRPGIMSALAARYQVVALDLPGHGGSDKPETRDAYGVRMAEDLVMLLDHLRLPRAHFVGYSLGGMVVVKLMTMFPDRVASAVVGGMGWLREGGGLQRMWQRMPARGGRRTPAACVREISKLAVTEKELKTIQTPVIVLVGDRDPVKRLYVDPLRAVRADWPVVEIRGAGHLNCILQAQFLNEISKWLDKRCLPCGT